MSSGIPSAWVLTEKDIFDGKRFPRFNLLLNVAAKARGVDGYITGTIPKPTKIAGSTPLATSLPPDPTQWISTSPSYQEWIVRDAYTLSMIVNNVTDTVGLGVKTDGTAHEAYESLNDGFAVVSDLALVNAERELRDLRYIDGQDFDDHLSSLRICWNAANAQGAQIDDARFRGIIIASLPASWNIIIAGLDIHKSSNNVISRLRMWDAQVNGGKASVSSATPGTTQALSATTPDAIAAAVAQAMAAYSSRRPPNGLVCENTFCKSRKRVGHTIDNCFMPGGNKEGQYPDWYKGKKIYAPGKGPPTGTTPTAALADTTPTASVSSISTSHDQFDFMALIADTTPTMQGNVTYADSGASDHCFINREDFATYRNITETSGQTAQANTRFKIIGRGTVYKNITHNGKTTVLELTDCLHTPDLTANLVSIGRLAQKGVIVSFTNDFVTFTNAGGKPFMSGSTSGGMYVLKLSNSPQLLIAHSRSQSRPASFETWHRRLGHVGDVRLRELRTKGVVDGLEFTTLETNGQCEDCIYGKQTRRAFDEVVVHEKELLERIHIDLWGPARTTSAGGKKWLMLCIDGASSCRDGYFLSNKESGTTLAAFRIYVAKVERQTGKKVKRIRVDGGGEFEGEWLTFCSERGIVIETTAAYSSSANGVSERGIRTTFDKTRSMLKDASLPPKYWAEAAATAIYLQNLLPSSRHPKLTPYEIFSGKRPDISHLRAFGCVAYMKIPVKQTDGKLAPRSRKTVLIGYHGRGSYRLLDRSSGQFFKSRDVIFEEGVANRSLTNYPERVFDADDSFDFGLTNYPTPVPAPTTITPIASPPLEAQSQIPPSTVVPLPPPTPTAVAPPPPVINEPRRSTRERKTASNMEASKESERTVEAAKAEGLYWANNKKSRASAFLSTVNPDDLWIPRTYKEAMTRPDLWGEPIQKEIDRLRERRVWHLVEKPTGANIIKTRWVFNIKFDKDGNLASRKARLVAKGFTQIPGVDFFDTYASVVRYESLRMTLAIAAAKGWKTWAIDFVSAYLNSRMKEDVYMDQPEGMVVEGSEDLVAQLDFSLYGTMQGASNWWDELDGTYGDLGYRRSHADQSVRVRETDNGTTITSTYTDDVTGVSSSTEEADRAKMELGAKYDMKDLGDLDFVLGIKIFHNPVDKSISLSQRAYSERVLKRFGMDTCNAKRTPLPPGLSLSASTLPLAAEDRYYMQDKPYREALGSLMYLMIATRPDLGFAVNVLSSFASNPGPSHWDAMKHTLCYLRGTLDYRIVYKEGASLKPLGFVDADYGGYADTRRSTSGELYVMAGGLVAWGAHHERTVALSTAEAEYMAGARGARQLEWMYSFMAELNLTQPRPATLRCDNQAAIALAQSSKGHSRVKHIDIRHHYIRERVEDGDLEVLHIAGSDNIADIMTKPLPYPRHQDLITRMGLVPS